MTDDLKKVTIYTDGGCDPNPGGPGGYGVVLIHNNKRKELSGGFRSTTNNRMEIYAALQGLKALKHPCHVTIYSDSQYLVDAMTKGWVQRWKAKNWCRTKNEKAINVDLWEEMLEQCAIHQVHFEWVRGHAGISLNERCDELAMRALRQANLPVDEGYENRAGSVVRTGSSPVAKKEPRRTGGNTMSGGKITRAGQPCRKCSTPVVKKIPSKKPKATQTYYFEYYLYCPTCNTQYFVEDAKRYVADESS